MARAASSTREKVEQPAKTFGEPARILADPQLSTPQKLRALDTLEQDERQLATASEEGMSGGEQTRLRDVMEAKRALTPPSADIAFAVVHQDLERHLAEAVAGTDAHRRIRRAMEALHDASQAIRASGGTSTRPPGVPSPGSRQELEEEIAEEKLDPGA